MPLHVCCYVYALYVCRYVYALYVCRTDVFVDGAPKKKSKVMCMPYMYVVMYMPYMYAVQTCSWDVFVDGAPSTICYQISLFSAMPPPLF